MVYSAAAMQLRPPMELLIPAPSISSNGEMLCSGCNCPGDPSPPPLPPALAALAALAPLAALAAAGYRAVCSSGCGLLPDASGNNPWNLYESCLDTAQECGQACEATTECVCFPHTSPAAVTNPDTTD